MCHNSTKLGGVVRRTFRQLLGGTWIFYIHAVNEIRENHVGNNFVEEDQMVQTRVVTSYHIRFLGAGSSYSACDGEYVS